MVVHNFNAVSVSAAPYKADTPLVVDTYAVLPAPVAAERPQPIGEWGFQILRVLRRGLRDLLLSFAEYSDIGLPTAAQDAILPHQYLGSAGKARPAHSLVLSKSRARLHALYGHS